MTAKQAQNLAQATAITIKPALIKLHPDDVDGRGLLTHQLHYPMRPYTIVVYSDRVEVQLGIVPNISTLWKILFDISPYLRRTVHYTFKVNQSRIPVELKPRHWPVHALTQVNL